MTRILRPNGGLINGVSPCFLISVFHIIQQKQKNVRQLDFGNQNVKNQNLGSAYVKKTCLEQKGHPPTRATLDEPTFHTFPFKTWRIVKIIKNWLG